MALSSKSTPNDSALCATIHCWERNQVWHNVPARSLVYIPTSSGSWQLELFCRHWFYFNRKNINTQQLVASPTYFTTVRISGFPNFSISSPTGNAIIFRELPKHLPVKRDGFIISIIRSNLGNFMQNYETSHSLLRYENICQNHIRKLGIWALIDCRASDYMKIFLKIPKIFAFLENLAIKMQQHLKRQLRSVRCMADFCSLHIVNANLVEIDKIESGCRRCNTNELGGYVYNIWIYNGRFIIGQYVYQCSAVEIRAIIWRVIGYDDWGIPWNGTRLSWDEGYIFVLLLLPLPAYRWTHSKISRFRELNW